MSYCCACEEERKIGYEYIYCIENENNKKLYFVDEEDTHFAFDLPFLKVLVVRVSNDSDLFKLAVDNSIKIKGLE